MGMGLMGSVIPKELTEHLKKLDTFEDMAADIKAIRQLLERQEARDLRTASSAA